jgi:hypothetical protein
MLRNGVIKAVTRVLRSSSRLEPDQTDLASIDPTFRPIVETLGSGTYYVEALEEQVPVGKLISDPGLLDDARKFMRRKGLECLAEAERLDALYEAVTAPTPAV